ncbi:hypothetical protein PQG02_17655 [Nostoc sp. UHCC 0926]|uniref:hypothetical protein n=1 Tax=unclassified Nostoc TaxID=2593658 RepID=UPI00236276B7|nr:hypothetical protein [Nostoc sp. UHCC 0926]WDD30586.1 hypothetical protein PQG02_17655 [Nostoc sp. UHCC 0926]
MTEGKTRRNFLITSIAVTGGIVVTNALQQNTTNTATPPATMPERLLGRTEVKLPIFGLGGVGQTPLSWEGKEGDAAAETVAQLENNVKIAQVFVPLKKEELIVIAQRTANIWEDSTILPCLDLAQPCTYYIVYSAQSH